MRSALSRFAKPAAVAGVAAVLALGGAGIANAGSTTSCYLTSNSQWVCHTTYYTGTAPPGCRVGSPC